MMLSARDLSVMRNGKRVLEGITCALRPGEITAIVGPNGAGKSSLLLALAGLLAPADGRVLLDEAPLASMALRDRAKAIGYLPQSPDIAWDVAVERLVALGRMPHRDRGEGAIEQAIAALDLEGLRHRPVSRLSGGERARVLLARVLAGEPRWILADEPLAALDLAHQANLVSHLKECSAGGQGVALVLHDLALAMNHAHRVIVLREGRLVADGVPERALSRETIADVWSVRCDWVGEPGAQALTVHANR